MKKNPNAVVLTRLANNQSLTKPYISVKKRFKMPLWLAKYAILEYMPTWLFYLPIIPYFLWLALKSRSFTFFTNINPSIFLGGLFGESKIDILKNIPLQYLPKTIFFKKNTDWAIIQEEIQFHQITFPLIAKPNVGERGFQVALIQDIDALAKHIQNMQADFIIQEYVDYEIELGVLYYRLPNEAAGKVNSIAMKEFLKVIGDGKSTVLELLEKDIRFRFQIPRFRNTIPEKLTQILAANEVLILEPIGNHCRGTKFVNANALINEKVHVVFNQIAKQIDGFYYGRFDLRVKSIEDLYEGKNIKIMELNGATSDPAHVFDPQNSIWEVYRTLLAHLKIRYQISQINLKRGFALAPISLVMKTLRQHFNGKQ